MKNILFDICLVILILIIGDHLFNPYTIEQEELKQQIETLNQDVSNQEEMDEKYRFTKDAGQNNVSHFVEEVSDVSREGIKVVVEFLAKGFNGF